MKAFFAGVIVALAAGVPYFGAYHYFASVNPGSDVLGRGGDEADPETRSLTGEPLFPFGNLYLDGRSSWCREQFEIDRAALPARELPSEPDVETRIYREPFTSGDWIAKLDATQKALRLETESEAVVVEVFFAIENASVREVLSAVLCSDFRTRLPKDPAASYHVLYPGEPSPDACLGEVPSLAPTEMMSREYWAADWQRRASDVWFLNRVGRDGDVYFCVYEAWKNCPRETKFVNIKMSAGQYAIQQRGDGCVVAVRTFYSGQKVPRFPGVSAIVSGRTKSFWQGLVKTLQSTVHEWQPDARAKHWLEEIEWGE